VPWSSQIIRQEPFHRYVEAARQGRNELWRVLLGALLIALVWTAGTILFVVAAIPLLNRLSAGPGDTGGMFDALGASPVGVACVLASFLFIWPGVWLALRFFHRRAFRSVLGGGGRLSWPDFRRGLAAVLIVSLVAEAAMLPLGPLPERNAAIGLGQWLLLLVPFAALVFLQSCGEELAFRGYLLQSLAARFRSPLVWGAAPGLLFTLVHWNAAAVPWMNATVLLAIAGFAATATILVYATGNLGAAMGVHFGMNVFGILFVSHAGWLSGAALFVSRPLEAPGWTAEEAVALGVISLAMFPPILWLLLSPRSPLRVSA
jgi:membrane protease YdiL (CAAX protease family)